MNVYMGEEEVIKKNMTLTNEKIYSVDDIEAFPDDVHAEVIDGQLFYMATPTRMHQKLLMFLTGTIWNYIRTHKGTCEVYPAPFGVYFPDDKRTFLEPDLVVVCDHNKLDEKGCHGAPDMVAEIISPSTQSRDYLQKLNKYQKTGVREYWILNYERNTIHVYDFEHDALKVYGFEDKIPVGIFEDLEIDFSELFVL